MPYRCHKKEHPDTGEQLLEIPPSTPVGAKNLDGPMPQFKNWCGATHHYTQLNASTNSTWPSFHGGDEIGRGAAASPGKAVFAPNSGGVLNARTVSQAQDFERCTYWVFAYNYAGYG